MNQRYLGRVSAVREKDDYRFAFVDPLLAGMADGSQWTGPVDYPKDEFPDRGIVFWHAAPANLQAGTLWTFEKVEHPSYDPPERREAFQVQNPQRAVEIVDLRSVLLERDIRLFLTGDGLALDIPPMDACAPVLIWISDKLWLGPLELTCVTDHWRISSTVNVARIESWTTPDDVPAPVNVDGARLFLGPAHELGQRKGFRNWEPDLALAKKVLRRLRKFDKSVAANLGTTYAVFDAYLDSLAKAGLVGAALEQELARAERIRELEDVIAVNSALLSEAVSVCLETEGVQAELEKRKAERYENMKAELTDRLDAELAPKRQDVAQLEAKINDAEQELQQVRQALAEWQRKLEAEVASYESKMVARLKELSQEPEKVFADLAILRAVLAPSPSATPSGTKATRVPNQSEAAVRQLRSINDVYGGFGKALFSEGLRPFFAQQLHACFLSGVVPVLSGARAYDVLVTFAECVAGGRLQWISIAPTILEPQDLLTRFDPRTGARLLHPGGLLGVLTAAQGSNALHLVVLEGFNRAPLDSYLMPLLACASDVARGRPPRPVPIAGLPHPHSSEDDLSPLQWPSNVLIAATPSYGMASLPVPKAFWGHAVLFDCDAEVSDVAADGSRHPDAVGHVRELSEVPRITWEEWRGSTRTVPLHTIESVLHDLGDMVSFDIATRDLAVRIYAAARSTNQSHEEAMRMVVMLALVPTLGDTIPESWRKTHGSDVDSAEISRMAELFEKLGE